ncbi:hypothetical protein [Propionispora hippei]|uniref:hypothetical protein n=1 Tax=Propionispora hippei TaxID=209080 RepID=UPI00165FD9D6|nr:hypothetical protein [Propionispora hippei]
MLVERKALTFVGVFCCADKLKKLTYVKEGTDVPLIHSCVWLVEELSSLVTKVK